MQLSSPTRRIVVRQMRLCLFVVLATASIQSFAADAELVGLLALATEPATAEKLDLNDQQVERLDELLDGREAAALGVASRLRDLTPEERAVQLRPLRVESQRLMAGVLTDGQLAGLAKLAAAEPSEFYEPQGGQPDTPTAEAEPAAAGPPAAGTTEPAATDTPAEDAMIDDPPPATNSAPTSAAATPDPLPKQDRDGKLSFNFRYQPWQEVLDWFAEQSDLSLVLESPPSGTFNYTDSRRYAPAEALDVLNSVLLTKGYTLVRRDRMLVLVNLEDGIPPNLVTDVPLDELDDRGEYELVRVLFQVRNMTPEAASEEVSRMIGPQGTVVVLPRAGMLQVTETAGRIRDSPGYPGDRTARQHGAGRHQAVRTRVCDRHERATGLAADAWHSRRCLQHS